ncbi:MAG: hypothetical protein IKX63_01610 [Muribaculaceae bacterium]|nr:hypothetical protein [Muribaculaceae bacterium]
MKRKNILWGWTMLIVAMICCWAFTSCGDDKDEPQNPLFGAWEVTSDEAAIGQLEQMIVTSLAQDGTLTPEAIEVLTRVKDIISTYKFVVQFNADGTARLYSYHNSLGAFVSGTWTLTMTEQGQVLLLTVGHLQLPVTNLQTDGEILQCNIGSLPLAFKKYSK